MTRLVRTGERGADFSFSKPPASSLLGAGFTYFVGYVSVPPASPSKNVSKDQCGIYIDAGLAGLLVWEMNAASATQGAGVGATHGRQAAEQVHARGMPADVPILVADDCGTTATNIDAKQAYMEAFAETCGPYTIGIYGGVKILVRCRGLWRIGWVPTSAWSWSVNLAKLANETMGDYNRRGRAAAEQAAHDVGAHVLQRSSYLLDGKWSIDPNDTINGFPAWDAAADRPHTDRPSPPMEEDDMQIRILAPRDSDARFFATCTATGVALRCEWTGPGGDPAVTARIAAHRAAGATDLEIGVDDLINVALDGPLPPGWSGAEFANAAEIRARGGTNVDQAARDSASTANAAVARVGQDLGDTKRHLGEAGQQS